MMERFSNYSPRYSYNAIFSDVCKARFNHLAMRLFVILVIMEASIFTILSKSYYSTLESLFLFLIKFILLYFASLSISIIRKNYLHVQFKGYSNVITHVLGQLFSLRTIVYQLLHVFCSVLISLAIGESFGLSYLSANLLNYYRIYIWFIIPTIYTVQHSMFDLDRLSFTFESQFEPPQQFIALRIYRMIVKCSMLTVSLMFLTPIIFYFLAGSFFIGFLPQFELYLVSFLVFLHFEFVNIAFNAHMSIGCLHKGKPISSLLPTKIETLISGLTSKKQFTKLTAFQELAYRATSVDPGIRTSIYNSRHGNVNLWSNIVKECLNNINESNQNVNAYLMSVQTYLNLDSSKTPTEGKQNFVDIQNEDVLFGSHPVLSKNLYPNASNRIPGSINADDINSSRLNVRNEKILLGGGRRVINANVNKNQPLNSIYKRRHSINEPIFTHEAAFFTILKVLFDKIKSIVAKFFFPSVELTPTNLQRVTILDTWLISKKWQAEKLIPLPVCHANSIISLMGLLMNAIDEDPRGGVVSSVGEVLKTLERSVGILGKFVDWDPYNSTTITQTEEKEPNAVSILYDFSISAFLEIVLKYNVLLNDVYLDEDVVKLSKWVLDLCN
ncbi:hypothetical protein Kpol_1004p53 [Vanderwaltozyma polyspora DSM 70294]|uniref:Nucleoporin NDC1 n=1 Tax=Vanderwaltozyma polyspora (strain ATCC 22028 / DSM 70294 / BCRC 21397 / CBS 2163 / NBRC 10782 / NRRL Y-8283 / UCD 57-17) TaxID=436907 RepID=A7TJA9_VANPO|nr:uncharacterized protein Kpol_1004p53 [Vanderwaltozyma polyspora DSM 70294]EDO17678.1 hypothetical protein Kpol_1004p53 [Vanderwaltozyma polyspora DSM 70294]